MCLGFSGGKGAKEEMTHVLEENSSQERLLGKIISNLKLVSYRCLPVVFQAKDAVQAKVH